MKQFLIVLTVLLFAATTLHAGQFGKLIPTHKQAIPDCDNWDSLGTMKTNQTLSATGTITMRGWQARKGIQYVSMTFKGENRPYCWWFARENDAYSEGRCDIDNNGTYEYEFDSAGRKGLNQRFKTHWPTAYE